MKVLTTVGLTKLIELIKNTFLDKTDTVNVSDVLATVAITGSYNDLSNKPSFSGYQTTSNLVTTVSASSTDAQYPSAKLFYDTCGDIETLINAL